jgi:hypothetical protein
MNKHKNVKIAITINVSEFGKFNILLFLFLVFKF